MFPEPSRRGSERAKVIEESRADVAQPVEQRFRNFLCSIMATCAKSFDVGAATGGMHRRHTEPLCGRAEERSRPALATSGVLGTLPTSRGAGNRAVSFFGRGVVQTLDGLSSIAIALVVAVLLFGLDLSSANVPGLVVTMSVATYGAAAMGLALDPPRTCCLTCRSSRTWRSSR